MTGAGKLAARLIGAVIIWSAVGASGQQPSNVAVVTPSDTSGASATAARHLPADMPPNPPKVTCDGDKLTISAQNSPLGAELNAIRACTGAQIDVPVVPGESACLQKTGTSSCRPCRFPELDGLRLCDQSFALRPAESPDGASESPHQCPSR